ncbi:MAG: TonB-dependent receptor [Proteobacteria bacterium]|nr:TonB-dependent receptor [Pseudomonadota bacterium]
MATVMGTGQAQVLDEIVVTATKREENIQDVPLAITAFTGDFLRDVNLDDIKDLVAFTPGVTGNSKDSFIDAISIRGIRTQDYGVGGDPSAAFFKNDLYEGRNGAVVSSIFDMERAEVLRGPQAFLFGRNAIGGAFNVHTKRPNLDGSRDGYVDFDIAERNYLTLEGGITVATSDNFALRFAGYHSEEDGYVENLADPSRDLIGHDKTAVRVSGLYVKDKLEVFFSADYEDFDRDGTVYTASDLSPRLAVYQSVLGAFETPADLRNTNQDLSGGNFDGATITTLGLHVDYDFDNMSLRWSTGYKDHDYLYIEDYDSTPLNVETYKQDQTGTYFQTELRLVSNTDGPLSWYAGVSYYREEIDAIFTDSNDEELFCAYYGYYYYVDNCSDYFDYWQAYYDAYYYPGYITVGPFVPTANGLMETVTIADGVFNGWAAYVDLTYAFNDQWDVSVGLRYSYDEKDFGLHAPAPASTLGSFYFPGYVTSERLSDTADWDDTSPRVIVRYQPSDNTTLFASYTEGYKAGGFGTFALEPEIYMWFGNGFGGVPEISAADGYVPAQFKPEDVVSYEIGYKGKLADGRVSLDVTAFLYEFTDLQVNYYDVGAKVGNAGSVDGQGIEGSIQIAFTDNLHLVASIGFLDTEARGIQFLCGGAPDVDGLLDGDPDACEGNKLYWAPEISGSAVLKGDFPMGNGSIVGNLEVFFESERGRGYEDIIDSQIDAFQEWAFRIGYASDNNWTLMAYVENLTDELTFDGAANNGLVIPAFYFGPSRPRTIGMRFGYSFD